MQVTVQTKSKSAQPRKIQVADRLFKTEVSEALLAQAVRTQLANRRLSSASTKSRGQVSGGGRKPWRQKGTGRARAGSNRSPIWRGGGVTFGPTGEQNYSLSMSARMRRQALLGALTALWQAERIIVIPDLKLAAPSTKEFLKLMSDHELPPDGLTVVLADPEETLLRSSDNIPGLTVVSASYLSTYQILNSSRVAFTESGLAKFNELFGGEK